MLEVVFGFVGKTLGSFIKPLWNYYTSKFQRPKLSLGKAPQNLFDHIKPASSQDYVRATLGPAHQLVDNNWFYHFSDALVQIEFWKDSGVKSVSLGLVGKNKNHRFSIPICEKPLGLLSIADVKEVNDTMRYRSSLRHEEVLVEVRLGPTGAWSYWTFGAMMAVGSKALHESYFIWNHQDDRLITDTSIVLVNWVANSDSSEEVYFDWSMG